MSEKTIGDVINAESSDTKNKPQKEYRKEMKKASQDLRFMQDCESVMGDFSQADEEVFAKSGTTGGILAKAIRTKE